MKGTPLPSFSTKQYKSELQAWNLSYGQHSIDIPITNLRNAAGPHIGHIFGLLLLILIGAAVIPSVANATTGITIAHSSFGNATLNVKPNPNVTGTPAYVTLIQVLPLIFVGIIIGYGLDELAAVL